MQDMLDDTVFAMSSVQPEHESEIARALNRGAKSQSSEAARNSASTIQSARARAVQKTWPDLVQALKNKFEQLFGEFAAQNPPRRIHSNQDGFEFATWLKSRRQFPSAARVELAIAKVARGFPVRLTFIPETGKGALVYRLGGGVHVGHFSLPVARRR